MTPTEELALSYIPDSAFLDNRKLQRIKLELEFLITALPGVELQDYQKVALVSWILDNGRAAFMDGSLRRGIINNASKEDIRKSFYAWCTPETKKRRDADSCLFLLTAMDGLPRS